MKRESLLFIINIATLLFFFILVQIMQERIKTLSYAVSRLSVESAKTSIIVRRMLEEKDQKWMK